MRACALTPHDIRRASAIARHRAPPDRTVSVQGRHERLEHAPADAYAPAVHSWRTMRAPTWCAHGSARARARK
jgi:hypothetical protein